ncbi:hypothetical protein [Ammoniphilus resinae]|uniref:Uncharacterized protein n=1 Tax=Ammoniphilus resinae TaxID=861532 RepID=A0ABS4GIT4_9BACL|nr:hypothetical protein [Ammoniphilus resinae]MBP1930170.1 hypothetical protein [Ammoniphilus resinae]
MNLDDIIYINSIPKLESELKAVQKNLFASQTDQDIISLILKEMLIRVRIKQIEQIIHN